MLKHNRSPRWSTVYSQSDNIEDGYYTLKVRLPKHSAEANFEAVILSPNGWVGSILISFLHKITHIIY